MTWYDNVADELDIVVIVDVLDATNVGRRGCCGCTGRTGHPVMSLCGTIRCRGHHVIAAMTAPVNDTCCGCRSLPVIVFLLSGIRFDRTVNQDSTKFFAPSIDSER
jgi:hypothetical protein